ncbi:MAG: FRG domain-containing protein [Bacteroidia bacterium]|nr:FRG domain-containing protein [Bacteroidia bacterium]
MTQTSVIEKFEDIILVGTTLAMNWFRGHSRECGELTPSIYRDPYSSELYQYFRNDVEFQFAEDFKRRAPSVSTSFPSENNHLEWLFLMQHHGVPTRLLDWSESILVATFFAVDSDDDMDGELWTLLPWKLNESHGFYGLPSNSKNRILQFLAHEIFHNNPEELREKYNLSEIPKVPMAIIPPLMHPRMHSQFSCFTIHPKPQDGYSIQDIIQDNKYLMRYIIPKELKKIFKSNLASLGISQSSIFPDLDGLAKTIKDRGNIVGWGQPKALLFKDYK